MAESPRPSPDTTDTQRGGSGRRGRRRLPFRWGQHIGRPTIRVSTAILLFVFVLCCVLYGYTSQRYGVVEPQAPRPTPKPTVEVVEPTYEAPPRTSFSTTESGTSTTDVTGSGTGTDTGTGEQGPGPSPSSRGAPPPPTTTRQTIPGLPNFEIPGFGAPTPTTPVPTR
ncbi:hypothetical protein GDN83_03620 [Gordonia jinghuaiqii]|uniref:Uncharacterized protein n=1 Tax=Gordonia jinghuaiqii TaxID=2758710 RepID=A0A7D7R924_9ACTN|nr:hypothetical protein [Gordonia jinghuaiqii]MCR5976843.1 hypothetical protein [Gordonia jinghuaiqii]QMT00530.1 hypothetical protein H1R19_16705 [Gordonia jinghuaiqii]